LKDVEEKFLVDAFEVAFSGGGQEFIAEIHQDTVVASGMLAESGLELGGHERGVSSGIEQMVETGAKLVARCVIQVKASSNAASQGKQVRMTEAFR
jgi:hypothetical protein